MQKTLVRFIITSKLIAVFYSTADVEDQICPVLMQLTAGDSSDDYRSEAVTVSYLSIYNVF